MEYFNHFFQIPFSYLSQQYLDRYLFLFPLGVIGIWRWSIWMMKEVVGLHYHPKTKEYPATVSLVIPVYNEDPKTFTHALASWIANKPTEIIAVIDYSDTSSIALFRSFAKKNPCAKMVITRVQGKRNALALGIKKATSEIIALVDSDTIWDMKVIRNGLPPFHDAKVAGVATYQSVLHPKTFAQKIFDVQLDLRYRHEYPFLAAAGDALVCLSGRTAFYRRKIIQPMVPNLLHETFWGKPVISGDDKCLTYLVLAAGWKVAYQSNSHVYTPGMADLGSYLKQRLRWSRNSMRADSKALWQGWPIHHPALFFFQIDKILQSFVVILSPIFFLLALYFQMWITATIIFFWWFLSRTIKMYSHLFHKPKRFSIVPGYVFYSFFSGVTRIYAFFSLNTQGWITRWDKSRLPQLKFLNAVPAYAGTLSVLILLTYSVYLYKQHTYIIPQEQHKALLSRALSKVATIYTKEDVLGSSTVAQKQLLTKIYKTKQNDTIETIAKQFSLDSYTLLNANNAKVASIYQLLPEELTITIPGKDSALIAQEKFASMAHATTPVHVSYDKATNTLAVFGRSQTVTLLDIKKNGGEKYIEELSPKNWYLKANIYLTTGVTLVIDQKEVTWLKMGSNTKMFTTIRGTDVDIRINGVKITSWDATKDDYDTNQQDGRSFIMVKDNARMDIYNSELAYLGYATSPDLAVSPYGVSWKLSKEKLKKVILTGEVKNSKFHHNYFGTYTYGATGMLWESNEFYNNTRYGLDPHDDSNGFLVEKNIAHDNGTHGIIFSKRCMYNTIRNNISYNNKLHGIMLHETSNHNIVENNIVKGNISGIAIWHSSNNIVRDNKLDNNRHGIRVNEGSNNNMLTNNNITNSIFYGFYLYDKAENNTISENALTYNHVGIYIKSDRNKILNNTLYNNNVGIYFLDNASKNIAHDNSIKESLLYGVYTKITQAASNSLGENALASNRKDLSGEDFSQ